MAATKHFITGASSAPAKLSTPVVVATTHPHPEHELVKMEDPAMFVHTGPPRIHLNSAGNRRWHREVRHNDVLLNNAGYGLSGLFEAIPREKTSPTRHPPPLPANHGGGVISVSSGAGFWAHPTTSMYSASKFPLEGFTEALDPQLASQNIFVKSVVPHGGITSTAFFTRPRRLRRLVQTCSILTAATDGTDQLRYFIGNDARGFLQARYASRSDAEYMAHMCSYFK
ncbi:short-chain dehydrogenase reductase SDR [Mycena olivaceomarginata]|nr:short-chain dehydrogenase reductase SDR [Mycena olivaceomarginata]